MKHMQTAHPHSRLGQAMRDANEILDKFGREPAIEPVSQLASKTRAIQHVTRKALENM